MSAPIALVSTKDLSREEWLQVRGRGIGGSDVAAIAGISPYKSALMLWLEKTGQIPDQAQNEAMYWGNELEPVVAKEFAKRTGLKVRRWNAVLQRPEYPWMLANIDREVVEPGRPILECKTASEYKRGEWDEEHIPDAYMLQVQHYLAVTGRQRAYIAVLIGGNKFVWKCISRDEELISYLYRIEADFWRLVETGAMPDPDGSQSSTDALNGMFPSGSAKKKIDLPPSAAELIALYDARKEAEEAAGTGAVEVANKLKLLMGDAEVALCGDRLVSWTTIIKKDGTSYRRFLIK